MYYILHVLILLSFGVMIYQDITSRHIHIVLPILIFGISFYLNMDVIDYLDIIKSTSFLVINFIVITVYFTIKKTKLLNPFKHYIGIGDLLFLIGVTPMFSFRNYVLFFITGMLFTLIIYAIFKKKYKQDTIPLAGYLSIFALILIVVDFSFPINLFYGFIF
ncbi:hypothetical protein [Aquimarina muelleri]|uniref:General secretion pathway protein n=1 Tax=Aquimarina muelleri TaxID=279356 RepID=A0A918JYE0_9FLAO|nr:hypothetical protein [Aquimarina muelleri]MCX2762925.1 hypothetical protein [Aquimarina muelleri]GGX27281.1 general secretion pathway protein [Aquimarina muelleri]